MTELTMFAKRLKEIREKRGLKQVELARILNVSPQTVSAYEKAEIATKAGKNPTLESAIDIAKRLGVSLDWLCGIENQEIIQKNKTYGDVARDLLFAMEVPGNYYNTIEAQPYPDSGAFVYYPAVQITSNPLFEFFTGWKKLKTLLKNNTIDEEVYQLWLDKHLSLLDKQMIRHNTVVEIENDDDLPF